MYWFSVFQAVITLSIPLLYLENVEARFIIYSALKVLVQTSHLVLAVHSFKIRECRQTNPQLVNVMLPWIDLGRNSLVLSPLQRAL